MVKKTLSNQIFTKPIKMVGNLKIVYFKAR